MVPENNQLVREDVQIISSEAIDGRYETLSCSGFQITNRYVITRRECCAGNVEIKRNQHSESVSNEKILFDDANYPEFCLIENNALLTLKNIQPCATEALEITSACWSFAQASFQRIRRIYGMLHTVCFGIYKL